jgi:uncharacterized protein with NRDE domain
MKLFFILIIITSFVWAKKDEVRDFNKLLLEDVQKDIETDNAEDLKVKEGASRAPASIAPDVQEVPETKTDKLKQLGSSKW